MIAAKRPLMVRELWRIGEISYFVIASRKLPTTQSMDPCPAEVCVRPSHPEDSQR